MYTEKRKALADAHIPGGSAFPEGPSKGIAGKEESVFHGLRTLLQIPLVTADGRKSAIRNFLFDDRSWLIRFLLVDAGKWFAPHIVAVPTDAVNPPDWLQMTVTSRLTAAELLTSPDAETIRPVSQQKRLAWMRHFGWREHDLNWCAPSSLHLPCREFDGHTQGDDPHLRRTGDLISYQVWAKNGYLGLLEGFFLKDASWHIGYLLARTGDWIYGEKMIPSSNVISISWGQKRVVLDCPGD